LSALKIDTIEVEGDKLEIKTTQPFPEFASELVNLNTAIIDGSEPDIVNKPIGTGSVLLQFQLSKSRIKRLIYMAS
jgi:peptide/nickel transport system substrate-binding protein